MPLACLALVLTALAAWHFALPITPVAVAVIAAIVAGDAARYPDRLANRSAIASLRSATRRLPEVPRS